MEYEGSIGFVSRKMKFIFADFHVLGLHMAKKHDLSDKIFSVCHAFHGLRMVLSCSGGKL
jgi:hypothetical protein